MALNDYHFITRWRVPGTVAEVAAVLSEPLELPRWWPSVYLAVREVAPGQGVARLGRVIELDTKGWLPYRLRWRFTVVESNPPSSWKLAAEGDFAGRGIWTLAQDGAFVDAIYDWQIRAQKPLLRLFSFALKPIFSANHHWAMRKGEESLLLELRRRRARNGWERRMIPPPPPPTFTS